MSEQNTRLERATDELRQVKRRVNLQYTQEVTTERGTMSVRKDAEIEVVISVQRKWIVFADDTIYVSYNEPFPKGRYVDGHDSNGAYWRSGKEEWRDLLTVEVGETIKSA